MVSVHALCLQARDLARLEPGPDVAEPLLSMTGKKNITFTADGRNALARILEHLGLAASDEVLLPAYTCRVLENTVRAYATPVFADVDASAAMALSSAKAALTQRTRAVVLVHPYGNAADAAGFRSLCRKKGIVLIEDLAQSLGGSFHGKPLGSFGDYAFCSFRFSKDITSHLGGCVLSNEPLQARGRPASAAKARAALLVTLALYRHAPLLSQRVFARMGSPQDRQRFVRRDATLSDFQRKLLGLQFQRLSSVVSARRQNAALLRRKLGRQIPSVPCAGTAYRFVLLAPKRAGLSRHLAAQGVMTEAMYDYALSDTPQAGRLAQSALCLPVNHRLFAEDMAAIADSVNHYWEAYA